LTLSAQGRGASGWVVKLGKKPAAARFVSDLGRVCAKIGRLNGPARLFQGVNRVFTKP
jgi:hypothetical protein